MSIINKVLILFFLSLFLMIYVSNKTDQLTQKSVESLLKDKYIQASDELFKYLTTNNSNGLNKRLEIMNFNKIKDIKYYFDNSTILYRYETSLSTIKVLRYKEFKYFLYMKYLDDEIMVIDLSQNKYYEEKKFLDYLILADIVILIIFLLIIISIIYPLKKISKIMKRFGEGNFNLRINYISKDEIGKVATTFDAMASNIEELILSRQRLLRDIGHELKTPISKGRIAIEMLDDTKYKKILYKALLQMDNMTNELLNIEKLNANRYKFNISNFDSETLVGNALSKLFIDDETLVQVEVKTNFTINADLPYLSIALKNLIDNGLKYTDEKPIIIEIDTQKISVKSKGTKLNNSLEYYCDTFTQGDNSRGSEGYGLGLSLVKRILEKHKFELHYFYDRGYNIFTIDITK